MSLEILKSIQDAEEKAEEMRGGAQREARDIIKSVESACASTERAAAIEHRALYQQMMERSRAGVESELAHKREGLEAQRRALCKDAETRLDAAATQIFERVVKHGHC